MVEAVAGARPPSTAGDATSLAVTGTPGARMIVGTQIGEAAVGNSNVAHTPNA